MKRLLLVEDEDVILKALKRLLERNHYDVECAGSVDEAVAKELSSFDLILADLRLPGDLGTALIPAAESVPVVIMTSHASVRSAVDAMRHGAIDYIAKPFDHDELLMVIQRSLHQNLMQSQNRAMKLTMERLCPLHQHVESTELRSSLQAINEKPRSPRFIHLYGECGTDKESLATAVHTSSAQHAGPFLIFDVPADVTDAESVLLGSRLREAASDTTMSSGNSLLSLPSGGYFQAAQNGTLVIRHPEHLSVEAQQILCDAVAGSVLKKPGNARAPAVNIISVSTLSITALETSEQIIPQYSELFRDDEYEVPALRHRMQDIAILAKHQIGLLNRRYGHRQMKISDDAMAALMANSWPGNVAELTAVVSRAAFVCRTNTIGLADLGLFAPQQTQLEASRDLSLDEYFRYFVMRNQVSLSETELASRLGISRKALWERRQKMNLLREHNEEMSS